MRIGPLLLAVLVSLAPAGLSAQSAIPDAALRAEGEGKWDEAIRIYRSVLDQDPHRADLWVRIADIEARRDDLARCIRSLEHAVESQPAASPLYARLSQAYASAGLGLPALHAIEGALALDATRPDYLRARATLATWVGDYRGAEDSYRRLAAIYPGDTDIAVAFARVSAWGGDTDRAVREYRRYLGAKSDDAAVWLELAKAESWRGNYAGAIAALESYRRRFGKTDKYLAEVASVFANGGRPEEAEGLLTPLLAQAPDDYGLNLTRTIALAEQRRSRDAFASLENVRTLSPTRPETESAGRVLRTLLASSAESPVSLYSDSDDLRVERFAPQATMALQSGTRISAGFEHTWLDARAGSGLEPLQDDTSVQYEHTWAGISQLVGSGVTFKGEAGYATGAGEAHRTYAVGLDARLADSLRVALSRASAPFVVSPRSVALGITAATERVQLDWSPTLVDQVAFDGTYQSLSDGNHRWELTISPRRTVARTARFNLDAGATIYQLGTSRDLDHGYYDPRRYELYAAALYPYIKVRENIGLALSVAVGPQRDSVSPSFHVGGSVSGEATLGIYRPWALKISSSATFNRRLASGAYRGFGASAALVRRF